MHVDEVGETTDDDRLGRGDAGRVGHGTHLGEERRGVGLVGGKHRCCEVEHVGFGHRPAGPQALHDEGDAFVGVLTDLIGVGRPVGGPHVFRTAGEIEDADRRATHVSHCRLERAPEQLVLLLLMRIWC